MTMTREQLKALRERLDDYDQYVDACDEALDAIDSHLQALDEVERLSLLTWGARCIYCGETLFAERRNQDISDKMLRDHIAECPEHPLPKARSERDALAEACKLNAEGVTLISTMIGVRDAAQQEAQGLREDLAEREAALAGLVAQATEHYECALCGCVCQEGDRASHAFGCAVADVTAAASAPDAAVKDVRDTAWVEALAAAGVIVRNGEHADEIRDAVSRHDAAVREQGAEERGAQFAQDLLESILGAPLGFKFPDEVNPNDIPLAVKIWKDALMEQGRQEMVERVEAAADDSYGDYIKISREKLRAQAGEEAGNG